MWFEVLVVVHQVVCLHLVQVCVEELQLSKKTAGGMLLSLSWAAQLRAISGRSAMLKLRSPLGLL